MCHVYRDNKEISELPQNSLNSAVLEVVQRSHYYPCCVQPVLLLLVSEAHPPSLLRVRCGLSVSGRGRSAVSLQICLCEEDREQGDKVTYRIVAK